MLAECEKQTAASHSSAEAEVNPLDAGLRLKGIPALRLWYFVIDATPEEEAMNVKKHRREAMKRGSRFCSPECTHNTSSKRASVFIFENSDTVSRMTIKGRTLTMSHVSRTHRVDLDQLFNKISMDLGFPIKCVYTNQQVADILTTDSFSREKRFTVVAVEQSYDTIFAPPTTIDQLYLRPCNKTTRRQNGMLNFSQKVPQPLRRLCETCQHTVKWRRTTNRADHVVGGEHPHPRR